MILIVVTHLLVMPIYSLTATHNIRKRKDAELQLGVLAE